MLGCLGGWVGVRSWVLGCLGIYMYLLCYDAGAGRRMETGQALGGATSDGQLGVFDAPPAPAVPGLAAAVEEYVTLLASINRSQHTIRAARSDLRGLVR